MQYWKPAGDDQFAGDMMPFWDGERFHLFYLLDHAHHADRDGLGGHQWAHASTTDLRMWEHHPLALPVGAPGTTDENGICTGSTFAHEGVYHAFYATRVRQSDGTVQERVCRAVSRDLVHFEKSPENPLFGAPPGLDPRQHRDPCVFRDPDSGEFQMLVTASDGRQGILAHYTSPDLDTWAYRGPFLPLDKTASPECPEHFFWNDWWYLVFSQDAELQYRISRRPLGPWEKARRDTIEGPNLTVPRTAAFGDGRRLAAGFLPWRAAERDDADYVYAGNAVFRELLQDADGTLFTRFVPEMMPTDGVLSLRLVPGAGAGDYGVLLRADAAGTTGYRLRVRPAAREVVLERWPAGGRLRARMADMPGLDQAVEVVVCLSGSIIDVCVNGRRTMVERCFDFQGTHLHVFGEAEGSA